MRYSIIGSGEVGAALARHFARSGIPVGLANSRGPESLKVLCTDIGAIVAPMSLQEALQADVIVLAMPFWVHRELAKAAASWHGKLVIDATNAYGVPVVELDGLPSSVVIARALPGAHLVKAFNHLPAKLLALQPGDGRGRRVIFLSGDDTAAVTKVATLADQLGFAPVQLGRLTEGGTLVQAREHTWGPLIFQDLVKVEG